MTIEVRSPRALSYLATAPGDLGLARAFVMGDLEVHGDLYTALTMMARLNLEMPLAKRIRLLRDLGGARLLIPPPRPEQEVRLSGRRHSKARDQRAISHHYDVSNRFYEWMLGPSMAYTCAVYPTAEATLEQAQFEKHDLVARKLALRPGMRLLDVGCGWGGMVMHAAREYGVQALGVTLSRKQAEWAQKAIADAGLSELAEVRFLDYRDVRGARLRRDQLHRPHRTRRTGPTAGRTSRSCTTNSRSAAGCSTTASPSPTMSSRCAAAGSSAGTCFRTENSPGWAAWCRKCTTSASRCGTRRTSASTTR